VIATREEVLLDVYVVTMAGGKPPKPVVHSDDDANFASSSSSRVDYQVLEAAGNPDDLSNFRKPVRAANIRGVSMEGTLDEFSRIIESQLDRPVVNETNLKGDYEITVHASETGENDFLDRLRDQVNLTITPAQRRVQIVALKPR
jgi:uncharacterized protein (TIGR03435 family)